MVKTTVYLDERDVIALRRMAAETGKSQAEIIRTAVSQATRSAPKRQLRSIGAARGSGESVARNANAILRREMGRSKR